MRPLRWRTKYTALALNLTKQKTPTGVVSPVGVLVEPYRERDEKLLFFDEA